MSRLLLPLSYNAVMSFAIGDLPPASAPWKGAVCFLYTVAILRPHLPVFESGRRLGEELPPQLGSLVPEAGLEPAPRRTGF